MLVLYDVFGVKFLVPVRFLMKGFCSSVFLNDWIVDRMKILTKILFGGGVYFSNWHIDVF